jgi:DNA-directed RNA polymerase subunit alpha
MKTFFLSCKEIRIEPTSPKSYYGCFYLGTFKNGQALTVANALRRTLLSEISGLAITGVKIEGVLHEYATLAGTRETVLDILLNLKEIVLKKTTSQPLKKSQVAYLQTRGPGPVRAFDLKLPPTLQIVDPEQYIATLSGDGRLNLSLIIEEGKEFMNFKKTSFIASIDEQNVTKDKFLPIEAVFSPIKKVNYTIESKGAESLQPANQIVILEIWTNGSLCPKEAIGKSLSYLRILFNELGKLKVLQSILTTYSFTKNRNFYQIVRKINTDLDTWNVPLLDKNMNFSKSLKRGSQTKILDDWTSRKIEDLGLPFRLFRSLISVKILTIGEILNKKPKELKKMCCLGESDFLILINTLHSKGLVFETSL